MNLKIITPVGSAAKGASISKYSSDRQGDERGRRQPSPDSYKPKIEQNEADSFEKFFAKPVQKNDNELSDFQRLFRKAWEDNTRMLESAKTLEQAAVPTGNPYDATWIWGMSGGFRPIIKK